MLLLQDVSLQVHREDKWLWKVDPSSLYTVRSAYNTLIAQVHVEIAAAPSIWHKDVPLKVVLFVWHLFRDRLPTRDNLHRRRVIDSDAQSCVGGCGVIETSTHLFFHCNLFSSVWNHIFLWLGVVTAMPHDVTGHFNQFSHLGGFSKSRHSITQVIWYATVWEIWKERNNRIFNAKASSILQVVDRIKLLTFQWLKVKFATLPFNYHGWWLSPFTLLGIG
jgi:hypothetical protein